MGPDRTTSEFNPADALDIPEDDSVEQQVSPPPEQPQRDEIDEMLDSDPDIREAVKREIRQRLLGTQQPQPTQATPRTPQVETELESVREQIQKYEATIDEFFQIPDSERNYEQFERTKIERDRAMRRERQLEARKSQYQTGLNRSTQVVEDFIRQRTAEEKRQHYPVSVGDYADLVRQYARTLEPEVLADEAALRRNLQYVVQPNAYMAYMNQPGRNRTRIKTQPDAPRGDAYMDDGGVDTEAPRGKYADATDEEREFLRGIGVLEDKKQTSTDLIPTEDGFIIPIGRGRRNDFPHPARGKAKSSE